MIGRHEHKECKSHHDGGHERRINQVRNKSFNDVSRHFMRSQVEFPAKSGVNLTHRNNKTDAEAHHKAQDKAAEPTYNNRGQRHAGRAFSRSGTKYAERKAHP